MTYLRVHHGAYGALPQPEALGLEAAEVALRLTQDGLARVVAASEALRDDEIETAIVGLRDYEFDLAAYVNAASRRARELKGNGPVS